MQSIADQYSRGELCGWDTSQLWHGTALSDLELGVGRHTLSLLAREAGPRAGHGGDA